jgi:hypothetical protein
MQTKMTRDNELFQKVVFVIMVVLLLFGLLQLLNVVRI